MPVVFLLLFSYCVCASEVELHYVNKGYKLNFDEKLIKLESHQLNLSMAKKKCNKMAFDQLKKKLDSLKMGLPLKLGQASNAVNFILDGVKMHEQPGTERAKMLMTVPYLMKQAKLQEQLSCK